MLFDLLCSKITAYSDFSHEIKRCLLLGRKAVTNLDRVLKSRDKIGRASCRERVEIVIDFLFLGSKITVDGDCRHEIKRCLLLGRKAMTNQDSVLKSRDITLLTKVHIVKAMVFPVVMYRC